VCYLKIFYTGLSFKGLLFTVSIFSFYTDDPEVTFSLRLILPSFFLKKKTMVIILTFSSITSSGVGSIFLRRGWLPTIQNSETGCLSKLPKY